MPVYIFQNYQYAITTALLLCITSKPIIPYWDKQNIVNNKSAILPKLVSFQGSQSFTESLIESLANTVQWHHIHHIPIYGCSHDTVMQFLLKFSNIESKSSKNVCEGWTRLHPKFTMTPCWKEKNYQSDFKCQQCQ